MYPISRSVLKPPVPVEEYLREQKERQLQAQATDNQFIVRTIKSANAAGDSSQQQQQTALWQQPPQPSIRDLDSLRTLLPHAHKHLLGTLTITLFCEGRNSSVIQEKKNFDRNMNQFSSSHH